VLLTFKTGAMTWNRDWLCSGHPTAAESSVNTLSQLPVAITGYVGAAGAGRVPLPRGSDRTPWILRTGGQ